MSIHNKPIECVYVSRLHGYIKEREGDVHTRVKCPYREELVCTNGCVHTR